VKLNINDIEEHPKELVYDEATEPLNGVLVHGAVCDFEFRAAAAVCLQYYRAGEELFFHGRISGTAIGHCGRCLDEYAFPFTTEFSTVLVPRRLLPKVNGAAEEDVDLGYYDGEEVDLSPLVQERLILALPTRPLCRDTCKGLCPQCGVNRNNETCACSADEGDPRLAVLRNIKLTH
jgi:DUF177 domain-containing protein